MKEFTKYSIGALFLISITLIGYSLNRSDFYPLIAIYALAFSLYILVYQYNSDNHFFYYFISIAILSRVSLLFAFPNLSDDIFRFVWDGRLWHSGINPFDALPSDYINNGFPDGLNMDLYEQLNSKNYFTIYPPIAQLTFYIATFTSNIWWSSVIMKLFLFAFELGTIWILYQHLDKRLVLLYALNPLLIIEIMGNLHFEGAMIFFLLLAYHLLKKEWFNLSAVAFALSITSKLLPLMFLPFLIYKLGWRKSITYFAIVGSVTVALFYPLLGAFFIDNFGNSLNLYFQKFEFNASLYYVLRWFGFQILGFNLIQVLGPILALIVGGTIITKVLREKTPNLDHLPKQWLFAITFYLICSTTVHPWYTALPVVLCLFTNFRFPIVWSAFIFLTYINYSYTDYFENLWIVALEYSVLFGYLGWEIYNGTAPLSKLR